MNSFIWWFRNINKRRILRRQIKKADEILKRTSSMLFELKLLRKGKSGKERLTLLQRDRELRDIRRYWTKQRLKFNQTLKYLSW